MTETMNRKAPARVQLEGKKMSSRKLPLVVLGVVSVIVVALAITNPNMVAFSLFGATTFSLPEGVILAVAYVLGVGFTMPLLFARAAAEASSHKRLTEWEQQDNKLAMQVQSDREKQLEAKIATLETALQKALKR